MTRAFNIIFGLFACVYFTGIHASFVLILKLKLVLPRAY